MMCCSGGKFNEEEAKDVIVQILNVVAFCHLQGVVHRDLKPEVQTVSMLLRGVWTLKCLFQSA